MVTNDQPLSQEKLAALSARDILKTGVPARRLERVPLERVILEPELTDPRHAGALGASMKDKGQASPTTYRARLEDPQNPQSDVVYDIIDGFHRSAGAKDAEQDDIEAMVHYGLSDEDLIDLRVHAIGSIKSVQFARVATWVDASYESTEFADWNMPDGHPLSSVKAFEIATKKGKVSFDHDLTRDEVESLTEWVDEKCKRWEKSPDQVHEVLKTVATADPELILQVREPTKETTKQERSEMLTPAKLQAVSFLMPGEPYYNAQHGILRAVLERGLTAEQANRLTLDLHLHTEDPRDFNLTRDQVYEMAMAQELTEEKKKPGPGKNTREEKKPLPRKGTDGGGVVFQGATQSPARGAETPTEVATEAEVESTDEEPKTAPVQTKMTSIVEAQYQDANDALRTQLAEAQQRIAGYEERDRRAAERVATTPRHMLAELMGTAMVEGADLTAEYVSADAFDAVNAARVNAETAAMGWKGRAEQLHNRLLHADPAYEREYRERQRQRRK